MDEALIFFRAHPESLSNNSIQLSAYTSAEVDFMLKLNRVCQSGLIDVNQAKVVANMVRWFSRFEWAVLERDKNSNIFTLTRDFIYCQIDGNLPRLSFGYKIAHILFLIGFISTSIISVPNKFLRRVAKSFL